jgi:hypothetical protein
MRPRYLFVVDEIAGGRMRCRCSIEGDPPPLCVSHLDRQGLQPGD